MSPDDQRAPDIHKTSKMDIPELRAVLESGDLGQLLGQEESDVLEAKGENYPDTADGRHELAKDVSAMANGIGGLILIGVATSKHADKAIDVVSSVPLVARRDFDPEKVLGVLKGHVYPSIDGVEVRFYPATGGVQGVGVIYVPPQESDSKPFLMYRVVEEGRYLKQIVAGYAVRGGASNSPLDPKRLQQSLRKGQGSLSQRLSRIEDLLEGLSAQAGPAIAASKGELLDDPFDIKTLLARVESAAGDE